MARTKRRGYGREVLRELGAGVRSFPRWRGRYVWWMQVLQIGAALAACWWVWRLAGGDGDRLNAAGGQPGPVYAALVAFAGITVVAVAAEVEARVTERRQERARLAARFGLDLEAGPPAIPDGHVLAYELAQPPGPGSALIGEAYLTVAAIGADRWDLVDPLWRFTVRESRVDGLVVQLPAGSVPAVDELRGLFRVLSSGRLVGLTAVEGFLVQLGARDVTPESAPPHWARKQ